MGSKKKAIFRDFSLVTSRILKIDVTTAKIGIGFRKRMIFADRRSENKKKFVHIFYTKTVKRLKYGKLEYLNVDVTLSERKLKTQLKSPTRIVVIFVSLCQSRTVHRTLHKCEKRKNTLDCWTMSETEFATPAKAHVVRRLVITVYE